MIVKISANRYVNFANMTDVEVKGDEDSLSVTIYWNYQISDGEASANYFYGDEAQVVIDALELITADRNIVRNIARKEAQHHAMMAIKGAI